MTQTKLNYATVGCLFYFVKLNLNHCFEVFIQNKSEQLQSEQNNKILFQLLAGECM